MSRNRKRLTFKEKSLILEESTKPNFDKAKICKDFGIALSSLYKILKDKERILSKNDSKVVSNCKKSGKIDELENQLCQWIKNKNENGMVLSGEDIKIKAKSLSEKLGYDKEKAFSNGWLHRFKKRFNLKNKKLVGEKMNADFQAAHKFVNEILPELLQKF